MAVGVATQEATYTRPWLYPEQKAAIFDVARISVIEASTKSGKTVGCMVWLLEHAMGGRDGWEYWWVAPIYAQAKIAYRRMKRGLPREVYRKNDSELTLTLGNGAVMRFLGSDNPDSLYGEDVHACVIDEASRCFAAGTMVDTPAGLVPIERIRTGDLVIGALGPSVVRGVTRRIADRVAVVTVQERSIISSTDHRYFTVGGWKEAGDLNATDQLITAAEAMSLLRRSGAQSPEPTTEILQSGVLAEGNGRPDRGSAVRVVRGDVHGVRQPATDTAFLRSQLLSELEDVAPEDPRGVSRPGIKGEGQGGIGSLLRGERRESAASTGTDRGAEPDGQRSQPQEDERDPAPTWSQAGGQRWERAADAQGASGVTSRTRAGVRGRARGADTGATKAGRLPDALQAGHRQPGSTCGRGDRWRVTSGNSSAGSGRTEGSVIDRARVDNVEVYEQGSAGFAVISGSRDYVELYDLEVAGHPSFSVHGFLVHNCKEEAWHAIRSTLTATRGPVRIIGNVKGRKNWAYRLGRKAKAGEPRYAYHRITAYHAVKAGVLDAEEIKEAQRDLPAHVFEELYKAEASDDGTNPFGTDAQLDAATITEPAPGPVVAWGWDLAKKQNWTVGIGLNAAGQTTALHRFQVGWKETEARIKGLVRGTPCCIDSTGVGDPIVERLQGGSDNYHGVLFTSRSKQQMFERLATMLQHLEVRVLDGVCLDELKAMEYEYTRTGVRYVAPEGLHDDCVDAMALAAQCLVEHASDGPVDFW